MFGFDEVVGVASSSSSSFFVLANEGCLGEACCAFFFVGWVEWSESQ